ncbi:MAG: sugar phosphate isomerase/epimerase [Rudaea sp.]|uniref:sugar phosphate isomerase/epimerase family protein n=1 Tax=Rudaea sp. TaxID=2136325 RepID=UPI0039E37260
MNERFRSSRRRWLSTMAGAAAAMTIAAARPGAANGAPAKRSPLKWVPGLQLYTLGLKGGDDLGAVFKALAAIGYREVEFPGNYGKPAAELRKLLDAAGLAAPAVHIAPRATGGMWNFDDLPRFAEDLKTLGAKYAVVPIPYLPDRIYDVLQRPPAGFNEEAASKLFATLQTDDWKRTADFLNEKGAALGRLGMRLAYHNHGMDFAPLPGGTDGYRILVERTDPALLDFELDVGWAVSAKQDVSALFKLLGGRLKLLHLKDVQRPGKGVHDLASCDIGTGIVKWNELVELMRHSRIEHAFVEQETPFPTTPRDAVKNDYRFLTHLFAGEES